MPTHISSGILTIILTTLAVAFLANTQVYALAGRDFNIWRRAASSTLQRSSREESGLNQGRELLSNAERLARGCPLKKPQPRRPDGLRVRGVSATPNSASDSSSSTSTSTSSSSSTPTPTACGDLYSQAVQVFHLNGRAIGFLSSNAADGIYGTISQREGLMVSFCLDNGPLYEVTLENGSTEETLLGGSCEASLVDPSAGICNVRSDSWNYVLLAGVSSVPAGPPSILGSSSLRDAEPVTEALTRIESLMWTFDNAPDATLTPTWVNPDGTPADSVILAYSPSDPGPQLFLTGNLDLWQEQFPLSSPEQVTLSVRPYQK